MVSEKSLKSRIALLNKIYGFKGFKYTKRIKSGKNKGKLGMSGSGFVLDIAYGGYRLGFMTKTGGARDVSPRGTKREVNEYIHGMIEAVRYWKERSRLK
tara:strand:- start:190 stop:486 length:297 start_codon:yes stop_codon:yes gene_type:complete